MWRPAGASLGTTRVFPYISIGSTSLRGVLGGAAASSKRGRVWRAGVVGSSSSTSSGGSGSKGKVEVAAAAVEGRSGCRVKRDVCVSKLVLLQLVVVPFPGSY